MSEGNARMSSRMIFYGNRKKPDPAPIAEHQQEQVDARLSNEDAVHAALQSIADDAVALSAFGQWEEHGEMAVCTLSNMYAMKHSIEAWRALGGQTTDERMDAEAMFYAKGTGL